MSSEKNRASKEASTRFEQMGRQAYGVAIPGVRARSDAIAGALYGSDTPWLDSPENRANPGQLPEYMTRAFDAQRTGLKEGMTGQERTAVGRQDMASKGAVAGGNMQSTLNPQQVGAILAGALSNSRVQQGMATIDQTNSLMDMGLGGAAQAGSGAVGAAGNELRGISMMPNYNTTYAAILGGANLLGTGYGAYNQYAAGQQNPNQMNISGLSQGRTYMDVNSYPVGG